MNYHFYLGCYTHLNNNTELPPSEGIYEILVNEEGKVVEGPILSYAQASPSYFALSEDKKRLYAVSEPGNDQKGSIDAYRIEEGALVRFSHQDSAGSGLCHVCLDKNEKNLIAIGYHDATVQVYPLDENGAMTPMFCLRHHVGQGPVADRQEAAHAHSAFFTPDHKYVYICDLGIDTLVAYEMAEETGKLRRAQEMNVSCPPGSGPRHLIFSPCGRFCYVACELSSMVLVYRYDPEKGMTFLQEVSSDTAHFDNGANYPAAIRMSRDGKWLYVSNRGEDTIAIFGVNSETGLLDHAVSYSTMGWYPRDFILTEDEKFLIALNQLTDNLVIYRVTDGTQLVKTDERLIIQKPIAIVEA